MPIENKACFLFVANDILKHFIEQNCRLILLCIQEKVSLCPLPLLFK